MMQYVILGIVLTIFSFQMIVSILNYRYRNQEVPKIVSNLYDSKKYQTWLSYTMDNFKFGLISQTVTTLLLIGLLVLGYFSFLESFIDGLTSSSLLRILLFMFGFYLIQFVLGIPFSYYRNFVIEEKYGFNKMTKALFVKDLIKNFLLTIILGGGILSLLISIFNAFSSNIVVFIGLTYVAIVLILILVFMLNGTFVRIFNKLTPIEEGTLKQRIDALSEGLGFKVKRIYSMDASKRSSKLNAFFTGLGATKEVVLFDTLISKSSEDEILAVLGHELGHATHKDTIKLLVEQVFIIGLYVSLLGFILTQESLYTGFGLEGIHFGFGLILLTIVLEPVGILIGMITNKISRSFEYKADAFAAIHTSKEAMASALKTLAVENYANLTPHPLYEFLYYSHPNIAKRLEAIKIVK
jgi:STE24 endopeptidase